MMTKDEEIGFLARDFLGEVTAWKKIKNHIEKRPRNWLKRFVADLEDAPERKGRMGISVKLPAEQLIRMWRRSRFGMPPERVPVINLDSAIAANPQDSSKSSFCFLCWAMVTESEMRTTRCSKCSLASHIECAIDFVKASYHIKKRGEPSSSFSQEQYAVGNDWICPFCVQDFMSINNFQERKFQSNMAAFLSNAAAIKIQNFLRMSIFRNRYKIFVEGIIKLQRRFRLLQWWLKRKIGISSTMKPFRIRLHFIHAFVNIEKLAEMESVAARREKHAELCGTLKKEHVPTVSGSLYPPSKEPSRPHVLDRCNHGSVKATISVPAIHTHANKNNALNGEEDELSTTAASSILIGGGGLDNDDEVMGRAREQLLRHFTHKIGEIKGDKYDKTFNCAIAFMRKCVHNAEEASRPRYMDAAHGHHIGDLQQSHSTRRLSHDIISLHPADKHSSEARRNSVVVPTDVVSSHPDHSEETAFSSAAAAHASPVLRVRRRVTMQETHSHSPHKKPVFHVYSAVGREIHYKGGYTDEDMLALLRAGHQDHPVYYRPPPKTTQHEKGSLHLTVSVHESPVLSTEKGGGGKRGLGVIDPSPRQVQRYDCPLKLDGHPVKLTLSQLVRLGILGLSQEEIDQLNKSYRLVKLSLTRPYILVQHVPHGQTSTSLRFTISQVFRSQSGKAVVLGQVFHPISSFLKARRCLSFHQGMLTHIANDSIPNTDEHSNLLLYKKIPREISDNTSVSRKNPFTASVASTPSTAPLGPSYQSKFAALRVDSDALPTSPTSMQSPDPPLLSLSNKAKSFSLGLDQSTLKAKSMSKKLFPSQQQQSHLAQVPLGNHVETSGGNVDAMKICGGVITWSLIPISYDGHNGAEHVAMLAQPNINASKKKYWCVLLERSLFLYGNKLELFPQHTIDLRVSEVVPMEDGIIKIHQGFDNFFLLFQKTYFNGELWARKLYNQSMSVETKKFGDAVLVVKR